MKHDLCYAFAHTHFTHLMYFKCPSWRTAQSLTGYDYSIRLQIIALPFNNDHCLNIIMTNRPILFSEFGFGGNIKMHEWMNFDNIKAPYRHRTLIKYYLCCFCNLLLFSYYKPLFIIHNSLHNFVLRVNLNTRHVV